MKAAVAVALVGLLLSPLLALGAIDLSTYDSTHVLKEKIFRMHWSVVGDELHLALEVNTTGWIGFGIGETTSGSMPGADIVTAHVNEMGEVHIQDRFATAKALPEIDTCQSWDLVNGEEVEGTTVVQVRRKLNTGDMQDRTIQSGTIRVIWAYGDSDTVAYHMSNRGALAMVLHGEGSAEIPNTADIQTLLLVNDHYEVPVSKTYYQDNFYEIDLPVDAHIVAVEQVIDPTTKDYVHHLIVSGASDLNGTDYAQIWGWAHGVSPMVLPPQAGFRIGPGEESYKWIGIQTHFDNPNLVPGLVDNSGIRVYYTFNLREHDASVLELGDPGVTQPNPVHAGTGTQSYEYNCPSECSSQMPHAINVFADMLHMHQTGNQMWSTLWRNGELVGDLNRVDFYDFGFQQQTPVTTVIQPGDRIQTHCVYNRGPTDIVFGLGSDEEMCIEFLSYWPKIKGSRICGYLHLEIPPDVDRNFTLCGSDLLNFEEHNPTAVDPPGGEFIQFGKANDAAYECPLVKIEIEGSQPPTDEVKDSAAPAGLVGTITLMMMTPWFFLS